MAKRRRVSVDAGFGAFGASKTSWFLAKVKANSRFLIMVIVDRYRSKTATSLDARV
jgi:hypothetical protein